MVTVLLAAAVLALLLLDPQGSATVASAWVDGWGRPNLLVVGFIATIGGLAYFVAARLVLDDWMGS